MNILIKKEEEIEPKEILEIQRLIKATWPEPARRILSEDELIQDFEQRTPGKTAYLLYVQNDLKAYAESSVRQIQTAHGPMHILALGAVCVEHAERGKGLGALIVKQVFERIPLDEAAVCLFQTGVPVFYEKLDCRIVENQFINSLDPNQPDKNPFWDDHVMIYPKSFPWPNGKIDLKGKGF